jgi:hypothetical protein
MSSIDRITREEIENKVDSVFRDIRNATTPEEVVSKLIELSDFIDSENLTPQQLDEISGIGYTTMRRHAYFDIFNNIGIVMSLITASIIAGLTITALYTIYEHGEFFNYPGTFILIPFVLMPVYLLYYGNSQKWFNRVF